MAAEARQRREYEMSGGGSVSSWSGLSPRGDWGAFHGVDDSTRAPSLQGHTNEQMKTRDQSSSASSSNFNHVSPVVVNYAAKDSNDVRESAIQSTEATSSARHMIKEHEDERSHGFVVSSDTMSATDGTVSTMDFEDAMEDHPIETAQGSDESNVGQRGAGEMETAGKGTPACYDLQNQYYNQHTDGQHHYQLTEEQQMQSHYYHNQAESHAYPSEQKQWNASAIQTASTPNATNRKAIASTAAAPATKNQSLESSNAEDVLALSLELERTRAQLATTSHHLTTAQSHISTLQSHNAHVQSELDRLHSELESVRERSELEMQSYASKYNAEAIRASAAEEDATAALELAKDATAAKEECEEWLSRSLEEINLWKGRCGELERELARYRSGQLSQSQPSPLSAGEEDEPKKLVRFAQDSPSSPLVSEDGGYHQHETPLREQSRRGTVPPPSHPPTTAPSSATAWSTPQTTPDKASIASGRAFLYRASPALSPDPRIQVKELLKRTAETRRILKERLGTPTKLPPSLSLVPIPRITSNGSMSVLNEDGFASRQGAACRSVGKAIRESGRRLKLAGKWWTGAAKLLTDGGSSSQSEPVIEGVAELESMVREYCGSVEGKIGSQNEKIEELLAFCDHLEKELMNVK
ncbi:hypothetical protein ACHAW6_008043 [Cyclotella cf. meneghiniana]